MTAEVVRGAARIDPDLEVIDRLCDIWAQDGYYAGGTGSMHPLEVMRLLHDGETLGGKMSDDEIMIAVDQGILKSPARYRSVLTVWYKNRGPAEVKAKRLGISRSAIYIEWKMALVYLRGVLRNKGLAV